MFLGRTDRRFFLVMLFALVASAGLFGAQPTADAQDTCEDAFGQFDVSTAAEFNFAIDCFNQATGVDGDVTITLLDNINATSLAGDSVFVEITQPEQLELLIDGGGHQLSRGSGTPATPTSVLSVSAASRARLVAVDVGIELGPADTIGLHVKGEAELRLWYFAVAAALPNTTTTGVLSEATSTEFVMSNSVIDGIGVGIEARTPLLFVDNSTILAWTTGIALESDGGLNNLYNSTVAAPRALQLTDSTITAQNSTLLGDGAFIGGDSTAVFSSSIVTDCSARELENGALSGGYVDDGNNVGGCFGTDVTGFLSNHGCDRPTAFGCPLTMAIDATSAARGVGLCQTDLGLTSRDQRGVLRTPSGTGCDAGAFEYDGGCGADIAEFFVETQNELAAAMECFNATPPRLRSSVNLFLIDDFDVDPEGAQSVLPRITQPAPNELMIDGSGFRLRRAPGGSATPSALVLITEDSQADISIVDITLELGPDDTAAVASEGSGRIDLWRTAITASETGSPATGVVSSVNSGGVAISESLIRELPVGIRAGRQVFVSKSTIASSSLDLDGLADSQITVVNSTLAGPTAIDVQSGQAVVGFSTIIGDGAASTPGNTGVVVATSSIVNQCSAPVVPIGTAQGPGIVDEEFNVGGCFTPGELVDTELADNGCMNPTSLGCPRTVALGPDSPARGAGFCDVGSLDPIFVDQRGVARAPLGAGCDAGSFEASDCGDGQTEFVVGEAGALNAAIQCFNQADVAPTEFTIRLAQSIFAAPLYPGPDAASALTINQVRGYLSLVIAADGHTLGTADEATSLLRMDPSNQAPVTVQDAVLSPNQLFGFALNNESPAALTVRRTRFEGTNPPQGDDAVISSPGDLTIEDSYFTGNAGPTLLQRDGTLTIRSSTVTGIVAVQATNARSAQITNSTIDGVMTLGPGVDASVSNSTLLDGGLTMVNFGEFNVVSRSNVLVGECDDRLIDGGGNIARCLSPFIDLAPLPAPADNGCLRPTPTGCPATIALPDGSPAIGAGLCAGVAVDQRGEPRSPAGQGCDAGAYETPGFVPDPMGDIDANGLVENADVQALLMFLGGGNPPPGLNAADVDQDEEINLLDALLIAQQIASAG